MMRKGRTVYTTDSGHLVTTLHCPKDGNLTTDGMCLSCGVRWSTHELVRRTQNARGIPNVRYDEGQARRDTLAGMLAEFGKGGATMGARVVAQVGR